MRTRASLLVCALLACSPAPLRVRAAGSDTSTGAWASGETWRLSPTACDGVDRTPVYETRDVDDLVSFLTKQGFQARVVRPRVDLALVEVSGGILEQPLPLRVAILPVRGKAGRELHDALLEHGEGAWGVHRGNLAVLAPKGEVSSVVTFAARSKLACWGVLTVAALDDAFVVPGGYVEP